MIFRLVFLLLVIAAVPAAARESSYGGMTGSYGGSSAGLNPNTTRAVVRILTRDMGHCAAKLEPVYKYDCYRQAYVLASKQLNGMPSYAEAQKALDVVVASLDRTVKRNADRSAPVIRRNLQTFTPIKPEAVPQARKDFTAALDEAETILLRSADKGNVHFARIAEAVNSNKVLLRAILDRLGTGLTRIVALSAGMRPQRT